MFIPHKVQGSAIHQAGACVGDHDVAELQRDVQRALAGRLVARANIGKLHRRVNYKKSFNIVKWHSLLHTTHTHPKRTLT